MLALGLPPVSPDSLSRGPCRTSGTNVVEEIPSRVRLSLREVKSFLKFSLL